MCDGHNGEIGTRGMVNFEQIRHPTMRHTYIVRTLDVGKRSVDAHLQTNVFRRDMVMQFRALQCSRNVTSATTRAAWPCAALVGLGLFAPGLSPNAQEAGSPLSTIKAPLTTEQVVRNLVQMNRRRAEALYSYEGNRIYRVEYRGFPGNRDAEMAVRVRYSAPASKEFIVQSATGSNLIVERVFKKLLEAETEALAEENQRRSALTEENYRFTLIGYEGCPSGPAYVLQVDPLTKDKFLYRGRIWVDAEDFAVIRVQAQPARNPSFWTKSAEIEQAYAKLGDFWLPASNRSVTTIRLGGHAVLTILYKDYKITGEGALNHVTQLRPGVPVETASSLK